MNLSSRARIAFALGVVFLIASVLVPQSGRYLAAVGWIMLLVVAPAFYFAGRMRR